MADEVQQPERERQPQLILNSAVSVVYANGINLNISQSDFQITFHLNGKPVVTTALGLPTAKSLMNSLAKALSEYERKTALNVKDLAELGELLKKT